MEFAEPIIEGRLVRRYKRFLADVELAAGETVTAHCANPGSMRTCAPAGARVWLSHRPSPTRRLAYTWELVEVDGAMVCVNTARANEVVAEALEAGIIGELAGYDALQREVRYGDRTRFDFLLTTGDSRAYMEVKSATLLGESGVAAFPDAVTARGTKHLVELMDAVSRGHRAVLLFCCNRTEVSEIRPADEIDPLYGYMLRRAITHGVEVLAYRASIRPSGIRLGEKIPLRLPPLDYTPAKKKARRRRATAGSIKRGAKKSARLIRLPNAR